MKSNPELKKIFYSFYRNRIKAYLVATGTNNKYKDIKNKRLKNEVEKAIETYTMENIFMGQGINMLVSSFETFLKDLFIFQAQNNKLIENQIRKDTKQLSSAIEDVIEKNRRKFNFQNLECAYRNFKKYLNINLVKIFNETGKRFRHTNKQEQNRIDSIGFFNYFKDDIWPLRHEIIHKSKVPEYGKAIWGRLFLNTLDIVSGKIKRMM